MSEIYDCFEEKIEEINRQRQTNIDMINYFKNIIKEKENEIHEIKNNLRNPEKETDEYKKNIFYLMKYLKYMILKIIMI